MIVLPTVPGLGEYEQETELDGRVYVLRFSWDARIARWLMGVYAEDGSAIRAGIVLVPMVSLLRRVADARKPRGLLAVVSVSGLPPGLYDLHPAGPCRLVYYSEEEVAAASAS
jgi:hypothetical protein